MVSIKHGYEQPYPPQKHLDPLNQERMNTYTVKCISDLYWIIWPFHYPLGLTLSPPPTCCFPIWSLGYGSCVLVVSFLFIEPSTLVPLQLVYVIRKKFLGKWNKFGWLRKKIVTFCNVFLSSSINTYQNKNWMLSLTLIIWALPFPFPWFVPSSMVQLFLSWINNYSLKMQQQRISPSIAG